jgi:hypothetical protein
MEKSDSSSTPEINNRSQALENAVEMLYRIHKVYQFSVFIQNHSEKSQGDDGCFTFLCKKIIDRRWAILPS